MGEWRRSTWGDEITLHYGKALRDYNKSDGLYRVFGANGPIGWATEFLAEGPGVILGRKGAYRGVRYSADPFFVIDTAYHVEAKHGNDMRWLYYAIAYHKLGEIDDGSPIPSTTRAAVYPRVLHVPPVCEQQAIAYILGTLDDKIEINRRLSATLEALAQTLFKAWFIDFDPVRAKAEGLDVGLPDDIAGLFPDRLVESIAGMIPSGWAVSTLSTLMALNPLRYIRKGTAAPYLSMANMPTSGHAPAQVVDRPYGSGMRFMNGDTLIARITPCLENGKTAFVDFLEDGQIGWGSTEYIVLRPRAPVPAEFGYLLARDDRFRDFAIQHMTGTSGRQRVAASALENYRLVCPNDEAVFRAFGEFIEPLFVRCHSAIAESRTLVSLRETLLPNLMSGAIKVDEVERVLQRGIG